MTSAVPLPDTPALVVDADRWELRLHGEPVHVTRQELRILLVLDRARGRVVTRAQLAEQVDAWPASTRSLDVHVCRLRRKLGPLAGRLVTVRGVGWRLLP